MKAWHLIVAEQTTAAYESNGLSGGMGFAKFIISSKKIRLAKTDDYLRFADAALLFHPCV
jgi:hypothetical protein